MKSNDSTNEKSMVEKKKRQEEERLVLAPPFHGDITEAPGPNERAILVERRKEPSKEEEISENKLTLEKKDPLQISEKKKQQEERLTLAPPFHGDDVEDPGPNEHIIPVEPGMEPRMETRMETSEEKKEIPGNKPTFKKRKEPLEMAPPHPIQESQQGIRHMMPQPQPQPQPGAYDVRPGGFIQAAGRTSSLLPDQQEVLVEEHDPEDGPEPTEDVAGMLPVAAEVVSSDNGEDIEDQVRRYLDDKAVTAEVVSLNKQRCRIIIGFLALVVLAVVAVVAVVLIVPRGDDIATIPSASPTMTQIPSDAPTLFPTNFPSVYPTGTLTPTTPVEWKNLNSASIADVFRRDRFGESVSLSTEGPTPILAVANMRAAQAFEYVESQRKWIPFGQELFGDGGTNEKYFALRVSLSSDGRTLAVGVPALLRDFGDPEAFVRVFRYNNETKQWVILGYDIFLGTLRQTVRFGAGPLSISVASHDDRTLVAAGAIYDEDYSTVKTFMYQEEEQESDQGSQYYENGNWQPLGQHLQRGNAEVDEFGAAISLSRNGTMLAACLVSSWPNSGKIYIFELEKTASPIWIQTGEISTNVISNTCNSVSMAHDGSTLAVGANLVRVFQRSGSEWSILGEGSGIEDEQLKPDDHTGSFTVSLSGDGSVIAIGDPYMDNGNTRHAGYVEVYEYQKRGNQWLPINLYDIGNTEFEELGYSVSLSSDGSKLVYGSPGSRNVTILERK